MEHKCAPSKEFTKWRCIFGLLIKRELKMYLSSFSVFLWSGFQRLKVMETQPWVPPLCLAVSVCDIMDKAIMCGRNVHYIVKKLILPCTGKEWTNVPWEIQIQGKKALLLYLNMHRTAILSFQTKPFAHFQANLPLWLGFPLRHRTRLDSVTVAGDFTPGK